MIDTAAPILAADHVQGHPQAEAIDVTAVAKMLTISKSSAKTLAADGRLPAPVLSIGKIIRWSRYEVSAWLIAGCPSRPSWQQVREQRIKQFLAARGAA